MAGPVIRRWWLAIASVVVLAAPVRAGVDLRFRPGAWCDVVAGPAGALTFVRANGSTIIAERLDGTPRWTANVGQPSLYLRAAADSGDAVEAIVQANDTGDAYVLSATGARGLGQSFGQNAVAIGWTPARGFTYYVQRSPVEYDVYDHAGCAPCAGSWAATSQGFRDIQPDGTIVRGDDAFSGIYNGRRLWEPMTRGSVTVGQGDPAAIYAAADGRTFTVIPGDGFEPHVAIAPVGFVVAARTGAGAAFVIVTPPYPADGPPAGGNPEPPKKPVDPPPAPPQGAPDEAAVVKALAEQHPTELAQLAANSHHCDAIRPQLGEDSPDVQACEKVTNELKGKLTRYVAYGLYTTRDRRWGLLDKPGGTNATRPSDGRKHATDVVTWQPDGQIVDIFSDFGPQWGLNPADHSGVGRWIEPLPEDGAPPPPPSNPSPSNPPPPPASPDPAIVARVALLEQRLEVLTRALADLTARVATLESHPLPDLTAAIDAALVNYEVNGKTATDRLGLQHNVKLAITKKK